MGATRRVLDGERPQHGHAAREVRSTGTEATSERETAGGSHDYARIGSRQDQSSNGRRGRYCDMTSGVTQFANLEAERAVLGAILLDERGAQFDIATGLGIRSEDFSLSANREIFQAI